MRASSVALLDRPGRYFARDPWSVSIHGRGAIFHGWIHGFVYILMDPVIRRHARKSTSGGSDFVDGEGHHPIHE